VFDFFAAVISVTALCGFLFNEGGADVAAGVVGAVRAGVQYIRLLTMVRRGAHAVTVGLCGFFFLYFCFCFCNCLLII
jgi:hypothetical protein